MWGFVIFMATLCALMGAWCWWEERGLRAMINFNPDDHREEIEAEKQKILAWHREYQRLYPPMDFSYEITFDVADEEVAG